MDAQIDHLLIDLLLEVYVVESKSFRSKVQYANGGWERWVSNHWEGIPSPVEQNERHISVLKELITDNQIAPSRLGVRLAPTFFNVVLVQPTCSIMDSQPTDARIYRADAFVRKIRNEDPSTLSILKLVSAQTLHSFAESLLKFHNPGRNPGPLKEPITIPAPRHPAPSQSAERCQACDGPISPAEAKYCRLNSRRFAGQLLCRQCQNLAPRIVPPAKPIASLQLNESPVSPETIVARCAECGTPVDAKIVAFCRFNSKRLNRRTLCRKCQATALGG